jgi:hypothetical protein
LQEINNLVTRSLAKLKLQRFCLYCSMKWLLVSLSLLFFATGKVSYYQVAYIAPLSKDISKTEALYVYKGDTLQVVYSFWADGGIMAFMVLNKSNGPVYIDWTRSAYVDPNTSLKYYPVDRTGNDISPATEIYKTSADWYKLFAPYILPGYLGAENGLVEEPVTLLPAKSYLFRGCYKIFPTTRLSVKKLKPTTIPFISGMRESFPGWVIESDSANALYTFGNRIIYDTQKDFAKAQQLDNRFYLWRVLSFEQACFDGYDKDNNSVNSPYHSDKRYFISHLKLSDFD